MAVKDAAVTEETTALDGTTNGVWEVAMYEETREVDQEMADLSPVLPLDPVPEIEKFISARTFC